MILKQPLSWQRSGAGAPQQGMNQYPNPMKTLTVNTSGGPAEVFSAAAPILSYQAGSYPYSTAQGPDRFSFSVVAPSAYAFNYLTWVEDNQTWYSTNSYMYYCLDGSYTAHIVNKVRLNIQTIGQGVVTSPNFMYAWNPRPYQSVAKGTTLTPLVNANQVTMTPEPCPGWGFDHWQYKNAQGQWVSTPGNPFSGSLTIYMNWWTGGGIRVPDGVSVFDVRAVFWQACGCDGPDGRDTLRAMYANPDIVDGNNTQYTPRPACGNFVTNITGHQQEYVNPGNFSFNELSCNHGVLPGAHAAWQLDDGVSQLFQSVRDEYGAAINVTSAYRCPRKNNDIGSRATSRHPYGRAFDWAQGSSAANWAIAEAADIANAANIYLYWGSNRMTLAALIAANCGPTVFPDGWSGYSHGHADR